MLQCPVVYPCNQLMYAKQCHCVLKHLSIVNVFWSRINVMKGSDIRREEGMKE